MTLVDSSVWIEHFRRPDAWLAELLDAEQVLLHPFIFGELSLGSLTNREKVLEKLLLLDHAPLVREAEVAGLVHAFKLWGRGIGWVDCHLLASARSVHAHLVTRDRALKAAWQLVSSKN